MQLRTDNIGEYMKRIVTFVINKIKETRIWWHFNEKRILREDEEERRMKQEKAEKSFHEWCARLDAEEQTRRDKDDQAHWEEREELRDKEMEIIEYGCYVCGQLDCICYDQAEDFSEHPSLAAEDEEPMSPEYEYWFTKCDKCHQYPEFCPCDGKFKD